MNRDFKDKTFSPVEGRGGEVKRALPALCPGREWRAQPCSGICIAESILLYPR